MFKKHILVALAVALALAVTTASAQTVSNGKVTTAAPSYTNNTVNGLSLGTDGGLRVNCTSGCSGSGGTSDTNLIEIDGTPVSNTTPGVLDVNVVGGGGGGAVDITDIGGTPVGSTVPGALDITCVSGCVAGSGVSQGTATTAPPTYLPATNNPLSLDLNGNLRTSIPAGVSISGGSVGLLAGTSLVGKFGIDQTTPGTTNGVVVNSGTVGISGSVAVSGTFWQTTQPVSGTFWQATQPVSGTFWQATQPVSGTVAIGTALPAGSNNIGTVDVSSLPAIPSGANSIGSVTLDSGTTSYHLIAANSNNSTLVSTGTHVLYEISAGNNSANIAYLKIYNKASAPTCGTDTPIATYIIPGATAGGAGSNVAVPAVGKAVSLGLGICVVTGIADSDNTSVAASAYAVALTYR